MRRTLTLLVSTAALCAVALPAAAAVDWAPDPTFADAGVLRITDGPDAIFDSVEVTASRIAMSGPAYGTSNGSTLLAVTDADGTLDTTFAGDGAVRVAGLDSQNYGTGVDVSGAGVVGVVAAFPRRVGVFQWLSDGTPNASFAGDGIKELKVRTAAGYRDPLIAFDGRGRAVVAAMSGSSTTSEIVLFRLRPNGALDTTFSGDGVRTFSDGPLDRVESLVVDGKNRILIGTDTLDLGTGETSAALIRRLTDTGRDDDSFSGDGLVSLRLEPKAGTMPLGLDVSDGDITVALADTTAGFGAARLTPDGRLDPLYGDRGMFSVNCECVMLHGDVRGDDVVLLGARPSFSASVMARIAGAGSVLQIGDIDAFPASQRDYLEAAAPQSEETVVIGSVNGDAMATRVDSVS